MPLSPQSPENRGLGPPAHLHAKCSQQICQLQKASKTRSSCQSTPGETDGQTPLSASTNEETGVVKSRGQLGGRADTIQDRWEVPESEDCHVPRTGREAWQQLVR